MPAVLRTLLFAFVVVVASSARAASADTIEGHYLWTGPDDALFTAIDLDLRPDGTYTLETSSGSCWLMGDDTGVWRLTGDVVRLARDFDGQASDCGWSYRVSASDDVEILITDESGVPLAAANVTVWPAAAHTKTDAHGIACFPALGATAETQLVIQATTDDSMQFGGTAGAPGDNRFVVVVGRSTSPDYAIRTDAGTLVLVSLNQPLSRVATPFVPQFAPHTFVTTPP
jgi:hypothetical protein